MTRRITLVPGDGIGPEVTEAVVTILEAAGAPIEWDTQQAGQAAYDEHGTALPDAVVDSIAANGVALKGPVATPIGEGFASVNVRLRKRLDLYACLRPVRSLPAVPSRFDDVDVLIVRENTEGLYSGLEHEVVPGVVESLKIVTARASRRIAEFAFGLAQRRGRERVTAIHKANILKLGDGLFLAEARRVAERYPGVAFDERIIDAAAMRLVLRPQDFDVLLLPNLYGDIVSDLCAGLVGGLGLVPGANLGEEVAVFEAVHGSAPDIAGRDLANPTALLLSAVMMLEHVGERERAERIRLALERVLASPETRTRDLGGRLGTRAFADAVCREVAA